MSQDVSLDKVSGSNSQTFGRRSRAEARAAVEGGTTTTHDEYRDDEFVEDDDAELIREDSRHK